MAETAYFKDNIHSFGTAGPKDVIRFEFEYKPGKFPIWGVDRGCGCTTVKYDPKTNKLSGTVDLSAYRQDWPKGNNSVNIYVKVYMDDGRSMYKPDANYVLEKNPDKISENVQIAGMVVV